MASQDARISKFEADFKQQQSEMTNKIDTMLKAITDQITGTLPSDTVKNLKLGTHPDIVLTKLSIPNAHLTLPTQLMPSRHILRRQPFPKQAYSNPGLADETKSYPVGIVKDVEVHIGRLKLLNDFYVLDMKKDPETPLLVGREFLATANAVIDCRMARIADKPPKNGDGAWHAKIRLINPDGEEFTKTLQSIPTARKLSERESPREIIDLDHFYDTLYLMRRSLEVLRKFHWIILGGRFNQLSHVSSPLLSKPGEY
ncbi:MAK10-like protein [Tanacetum coccineum]